MQIFFISLAVIILLLTTSFLIRIKIVFDVINNKGKVIVLLFNIMPVFWSNISIVGDYLNFVNNRNKTIKIKIDLNDKHINFFNDFWGYLKNKIYFNNISISSLMGFENPFISCLFSAVINVFVSNLFAHISTIQRDIDLNKNILTAFRHTEIKFDISISLMISLYDLFISYFNSVLKEKRRLNEKENNI